MRPRRSAIRWTWCAPSESSVLFAPSFTLFSARRYLARSSRPACWAEPSTARCAWRNRSSVRSSSGSMSASWPGAASTCATAGCAPSSPCTAPRRPDLVGIAHSRQPGGGGVLPNRLRDRSEHPLLYQRDRARRREIDDETAAGGRVGERALSIPDPSPGNPFDDRLRVPRRGESDAGHRGHLIARDVQAAEGVKEQIEHPRRQQEQAQPVPLSRRHPQREEQRRQADHDELVDPDAAIEERDRRQDMLDRPLQDLVDEVAVAHLRPLRAIDLSCPHGLRPKRPIAVLSAIVEPAPLLD